jgi:ABC-type multidrug transport system ATPase subunit
MLSIFLFYFVMHIIVIDAFNNKGNHSQLVLWHNVSVSYNNRTIIKTGIGYVEKKHLLGIIGPSGCGKTTFLNLISNRLYNTSSMKIGGYFQSVSDKNDIAFVYQDDAFFSMLTVNETLQTAQDLKRENGLLLGSYEIESLLLELGLAQIANSRIGDSSKRGISGGERKRLSVATQLLGSPKLLVADEATSGNMH